MIIESADPQGSKLGIEYHAKSIRDAIEEAYLDGYVLDTGDEEEIRTLDLNNKNFTAYVKIICEGVLLKDMVER